LLLATNTWNSQEHIVCKTEQDFYMTVEQAIGFGVINDALHTFLYAQS